MRDYIHVFYFFAMRVYHESNNQIAFIRWLSLAHPHISKVTFCVPNAGKRTKIQGQRLKNEGMKKGVLDLVILYPFNSYHGMLIEFKHGKNKLTPEQSEMISLLEAQNYFCCVCYSWDEAKDKMELYLRTH